MRTDVQVKDCGQGERVVYYRGKKGTESLFKSRFILMGYCRVDLYHFVVVVEVEN